MTRLNPKRVVLIAYVRRLAYHTLFAQSQDLTVYNRVLISSSIWHVFGISLLATYILRQCNRSLALAYKASWATYFVLLFLTSRKSIQSNG